MASCFLFFLKKLSTASNFPSFNLIDSPVVGGVAAETLVAGTAPGAAGANLAYFARTLFNLLISLVLVASRNSFNAPGCV